MSASTPKKATAKKSAPKRTAQQRAEEHQERFDALRARANGLGLQSSFAPPSTAPYVITAAEIGDGINQDIEFQRPTDLQGRINLTRMISTLGRFIRDKQLDEALAMFPDLLVALSNGAVLDRILRALSAEDDGDALLLALAVNVMEHFSGKGAVDVPGGTTAS